MNTQISQIVPEKGQSESMTPQNETLGILSQVENTLRFAQVQEALSDLAFDQETPESYDMQIVSRNDIEAYFGAQRPEFLEGQRRIVYPARLIKALEGLYEEYDRAFAKLIKINMEFSGDYVEELGIKKTFVSK